MEEIEIPDIEPELAGLARLPGLAELAGLAGLCGLAWLAAKFYKNTDLQMQLKIGFILCYRMLFQGSGRPGGLLVASGSSRDGSGTHWGRCPSVLAMIKVGLTPQRIGGLRPEGPNGCRVSAPF